MVAVPADTPATLPEPSTVAIPLLLLLHTPADVTSANAMDVPTHVLAAPVIDPADGAGLTDTVCETELVPQPLVTVYDISAVPVVTPVTTPAALTVATPALSLLHTPPVVASLKVMVAPVHTIDAPVTPEGNEFTVTTAMTGQLLAGV